MSVYLNPVLYHSELLLQDLVLDLNFRFQEIRSSVTDFQLTQQSQEREANPACEFFHSRKNETKELIHCVDSVIISPEYALYFQQ